jgi:hypothetical protein
MVEIAAAASKSPNPSQDCAGLGGHLGWEGMRGRHDRLGARRPFTAVVLLGSISPETVIAVFCPLSP